MPKNQFRAKRLTALQLLKHETVKLPYSAWIYTVDQKNATFFTVLYRFGPVYFTAMGCQIRSEQHTNDYYPFKHNSGTNSKIINKEMFHIQSSLLCHATLDYRLNYYCTLPLNAPQRIVPK